MEKAYDFKALAKELKGHGLEVAEDAAEVMAKAVLKWIQDSAKMSENKYDDLLLAVVPLAEAQIFVMIDKIDGQEG